MTVALIFPPVISLTASPAPPFVPATAPAHKGQARALPTPHAVPQQQGPPTNWLQQYTEVHRALSAQEISAILDHLLAEQRQLAAQLPAASETATAQTQAQLSDVDGAVRLYQQLKQDTERQEWQRASYAVNTTQIVSQNAALADANTTQRMAAACGSLGWMAPGAYPPAFGMGTSGGYFPYQGAPLPSLSYPIR